MSQRDFKLLNPWYSEQMFIWDDEPSKRATIVHEWSDNIKQRLGMKLGAMEWEAHTVEKGIPCLIYHELTTHDFFGKKFLWINIGVEPKMSPFGGKEFYEDMKENFSSVLGIHNNLFLPIPIPSDEIFLKYTYVSYGFDNESDIKSNISNIATFIGRGPPRPPLDYCHGKVSKLGVGKPPLSRLWKEEIGDDNKTQLTNFIYPDIFIIHATPHKMDYHDSAQEVVSYHTLLKNLGLLTGLYNGLLSHCKSDGTKRVLDILEGLSRPDSVAYSMVRAIKRKDPPPPLGRLNELAKICLEDIVLESVNQNWQSLKEVSMYPYTIIENFLKELSGLRAAYVDESLLKGHSVGPNSKPICFAFGKHLFPDCDKGISLLNVFAHLSRMIYEKIRFVSREEDFKNLILAVLEGYRPITETHHGDGIPDILVPCKNEKYVVVECKVWRYPKQIIKDLQQIAGYIGPSGDCGFLVYFVSKNIRDTLMPVEMLRKNIGYDSVCSSSDAVVEIDVPGHSEKVPVAILFSLAPTERTPQVA